MEQRFDELLKTAFYHKVTDIHFNIIEHETSIRMRGIDGLIRIDSSPEDERLFNYLEYQANLDITSFNKPQTGAFSHFFEGETYDFRFAVIETRRQRTGVLRILNFHHGLTFEQLTYDTESLDIFRKLVRRKTGLILFTGLTGSGKTTTLYSLLNTVRGKTIYSIEDPIEVIQNNMIQLEINEKTGFGYDEGIKQILRHNPDMIMIGEIRDELTAQMCIRAALTGCLVLSSLHARSCATAINRLTELGVKREDLRDCAVGIVNQRLVKLRKTAGYTCIYDILQNEELYACFKDSEPFRNRMEEKLMAAAKAGIIEDEEGFI